MRLDQYLVNQNFFKSRTQAQEAIKKGSVSVLENSVWKTQRRPSYVCTEGVQIKCDTTDFLWVSRAGLKLEGALKSLNLNLENKTALDIGQSTGGFTDVLLSKGVKQVIGLDVGKNQLHAKIRAHEKVKFYENTDARDLSFIKDEHINFFTVDLSFISLLKVAPEIYNILNNKEASGLFLVKPQFEVGRSLVGKGGLVKSAEIQLQCEKDVVRGLEDIGFNVLDYFPSILKGKDGNQEFFCFVST